MLLREYYKTLNKNIITDVFNGNFGFTDPFNTL